MNMIVSTAALASAPVMKVATDPIFALIENHKRISVEYNHIVTSMDEDDPVREPILDNLGDAEENAAIELLTEVPTSLAGVQAILEYAADWEATGCRWPDGLREDDMPDAKIGKPWSYFLHRNIVESLQKLAA